jgi:translation initiation factor IF-2
MSDIRVGKVTHFFDRISVAVLALDGQLAVGDTIRFRGHETDFEQKVESLQVEHEAVNSAGPGQEVAMKVAQKARENDEVIKIDSDG